MSFLVPLVQRALAFSVNFIPYEALSFFHHDQWRGITPKDYFYLRNLERYAIKNENSIAYDYYKSLVFEQAKKDQHNHFCLALIIAAALDGYAYTRSADALFVRFFSVFLEEEISFFNFLISNSLLALMIYCIYFGFIKGCGFSLSSTEKIYFPDHNFK
jgi:hypothetical protein